MKLKKAPAIVSRVKKKGGALIWGGALNRKNTVPEVVLFIVKFCNILVIISVFDIKSNLFSMFIHILDQSLFDCRVKSF